MLAVLEREIGMGRKTIVILCMSCAVVISATLAQNSSATLAGTTAFTCAGVSGTGGFSDAHCTNKTSGGNYSHAAIEAGKSTELSGTNTNTCSSTTTACPLKITGINFGMPLELEAKKASITGSLQNVFEGEEHRATSTWSFTLQELAVLVPSGIGCKIKGGEITSKALKATTQGIGMFYKIEANEGTILATFTIEGCSTSEFNRSYNLTGSVKATASGTTIGFTEAGTTEQGTFQLAGQKAGLDGQLTLSGRANSGEAYTPVAFTTEEELRFTAAEYPATLSGNQAVQHSFAAGSKKSNALKRRFPGR